ncbi:MAG: disulfide reductase, partial [Deltaproteobacteria bacterium]|nr:disulfide reductase [Deltaproteobacteria bacterium]
YQDKIGEEMGITVDLPIIYFTELIGLAMKEREVENWLSRHFVDPLGLLEKQNLLAKLWS